MDDAFSHPRRGEEGTLDYGLWILRIAGWDGLLPVIICLASMGNAVLFPQNEAVQILAVLTLPIAGFLGRGYMGFRQIDSNRCGQWVQVGQVIALTFALLLFLAFDFVIVLSEWHLPPEDIPIWTGMVAAYFALVTFAMYPGRGLTRR